MPVAGSCLGLNTQYMISGDAKLDKKRISMLSETPVNESVASLRQKDRLLITRYNYSSLLRQRFDTFVRENVRTRSMEQFRNN